MKLVAITGKIGSGKSVVSRIVSAMGFPLYDCDTKAKILMETNSRLIRRLLEAFGNDIYNQSRLNRARLSEIAFSSPESLKILNSIVHEEVRQDILEWKTEIQKSYSVGFVETAILQTAQIDTIVDYVWWIEASEEIRQHRVVRFRNFKEEDFYRRNEAQKVERFQDNYVMIKNLPDYPLLPQIEVLISGLLNER